MKFLPLTLAAMAAFAVSAPVLAQDAYVPSSDAFTLHRIDAGSGAATQSINIPGNYPTSLAFSPNGRYAYTTDSSGGLSIIDLAAPSPVASRHVIGRIIYDIDVAPDGRLFLTDGAGDSAGPFNPGGAIRVVAADGVTVLGSVEIPVKFLYKSALSLDADRLWVLDTRLKTVNIFSTDDTPADTGSSITLDRAPTGLAFSPSHPLVYLTEHDTNNSALEIIDATNLSVIRRVATCEDPGFPTVNAAGNRLYVGCADGQAVSVYDLTATSEVEAFTIPLSYNVGGLSLSADGAYLFVIDRSNGRVLRFATAGMSAASSPVSIATIGGDPATAGPFIRPPYTASVPAPVPTMTEWAMILLGLMLAGGAAAIIQRRRLAA